MVVFLGFYAAAELSHLEKCYIWGGCNSHFGPIWEGAYSKFLMCREEVETRKIGRNETWTFQGLFPGCYGVDEKPGKKHVIIVSFLMKRACMAD